MDETKDNLSIKNQLWTTIINYNHNFIGGVVTNQTFNTYYPYKVWSTTFSWMRGHLRVEVEPVNWYEMEGGNPVVDFNGFENYTTRILRPPNIETGIPELNMIVEKYQYKDELIVNNELGGTKWNQITDTINGTDTPIMEQLDVAT